MRRFLTAGGTQLFAHPDNIAADNLTYREQLKTADLDTYFKDPKMTLDELLNKANTLVRTYMSGLTAHRAGKSKAPLDIFPQGSPWTPTRSNNVSSDSSIFDGDQVLANTILRMRDSMVHYEFQAAIADGDIGRVMNIIAVSQIALLTFVDLAHSRLSQSSGRSRSAEAARANIQTSSWSLHATSSTNTPMR